MRVLLSIRPVHVESIVSGVKRYEFRRRLFVRRDIRSVLIYCTMPVGRIVGEFELVDVLEDEPEALWASTSSKSGISKEYYDAYFATRKRAFALQIGELHVFDKPICPHEWFDNFTPPQSYMYVPLDASASHLTPQKTLI